MPRRTYSQYCGLARALDLVGERWTLLIVRDLAIAPRRFSDLLSGLPGIGTSLLSERLRSLETDGILERAVAPASPPQARPRRVASPRTPATRRRENGPCDSLGSRLVLLWPGSRPVVAEPIGCRADGNGPLWARGRQQLGGLEALHEESRSRRW